MAQTHPSPLELEDHRRFHFGFWRVQRAAWLLFGLIVTVALLGLTGGGGPLSHQRTALPGGEIDHPRVGRRSAADEMRIRLEPGGRERELLLSAGFADHFQIEDIQPVPSRDVAATEGHRLIFETEEGQPAAIVLHVRAQRPGIADYTAALDGGAPQPMRSVVLP